MIRPRSDWGARPARGAYSWLPNSVGVAVHWEGPHMGIYPQTSVPHLLRAIQNYHMDHPTTGWNDIAYSFIVDRYGDTWEGRGWNARTAANGSNAGNSGYLAVCYLGGEGDEFTAPAARAIGALFAAHLARGGRADFTGHRDHTPTACPGDTIYAWVRGAPLTPQDEELDDLTPEQAQQLAQLHAWVNPAVAGGGDTYLPAMIHRLTRDAVATTPPAGIPELHQDVVGLRSDLRALTDAIRNMTPAGAVDPVAVVDELLRRLREA